MMGDLLKRARADASTQIAQMTHDRNSSTAFAWAVISLNIAASLTAQDAFTGTINR